MGTKILHIFILIATLSLLSCSSGGDVAGTGSSTGNAKVVATISGYVANSKAVVSLLPTNYNPGSVLNLYQPITDTTDSAGFYSFEISDSLISLDFNLDIVEISGERKYFEKHIKASFDTTGYDTATLQIPGILKIIVSGDSIDNVNGYLFIPGTRLKVNFSDRAIFDTVNYTLYINSVPASFYSQINYAVKGAVASSVIMDTTFEVLSADTSVLGEYKPVIVSYNSTNSGIPNDEVFSVSTDPFGGRWFGTNNGDFARFTGDSGWVVNNTIEYGINSSVLAISAESKGRMWFGTHGAIFTIGTDGILTVLDPVNSPFPGGSVYAIIVDGYDVKWLACYARGLLAIEGNGERWTLFSSENSGLPSNYIHDVASDLNQIKWVTTLNGIASYSNGKFTDLSSDTALCVAVDSNNVKWFGLLNGNVASYDGNSYVIYKASDCALSGSSVYSVAVDKKNVKWFGTKDSDLLSFDGKNWKSYSEFIPEKASRILNISVDFENNKWVATETAGAVFVSATVTEN